MKNLLDRHQPGITQFLLKRGAGSHANRGHDRKNRRFWHSLRNAKRKVKEVLWGVFGEKHYSRLPGKSLYIRRVRQAAGADIALNNFGKIFLVKRYLPLRHFHHARAVRMATGHWGAKIRQTGRNHGTQIPCSIDADLHRPSLGTETVRPSYLLFTPPIASWAEYGREMNNGKKDR